MEKGNMSANFTIDWDAAVTACEAINGIVLCVTLWMVLTMIVYGVQAGKFKNTMNGRMYITSFFAMASSFSKIVASLTIFEASVVTDDPNICEVLNVFVAILAPVTQFSAYFCLWLRQRSFYEGPVMKNLHGRWLIVFSWAMLVLISLHQLLSAVLVLIFFRGAIVPDPKGCFSERGASEISIIFVLVILQILSQAGLLFLFVYPLVKNRCCCCCVKENAAQGGQDQKMDLARRSVILASTTVISDILLLTVPQNLLPPSHPSIIGITQLTVANFVNNICLLAFFKDYKAILKALFPCENLTIVPSESGSSVGKGSSVGSSATNQSKL